MTLERLQTQIATYKELNAYSYGKLAKALKTNSGTIWKFLNEKNPPTIRKEIVDTFAELCQKDRRRLYIANVSHLLPPLDRVSFVCMNTDKVWRAFRGAPNFVNETTWVTAEGEIGIPLTDLITLPPDLIGADFAKYQQLPTGWEKVIM